MVCVIKHTGRSTIASVYGLHDRVTRPMGSVASRWMAGERQASAPIPKLPVNRFLTVNRRSATRWPCHIRARTGSESGALTATRGPSGLATIWAAAGQKRAWNDLLSSRSRVRVALGALRFPCSGQLSSARALADDDDSDRRRYWTVPASVDTRLSCPIRRESEKWVRHAAHIRRSTRRSR